MKTYFYNRSCFRLLPDGLLPDGFVRLDDRFDVAFTTQAETISDVRVTMAENICRRLSDIDFFAHAIATNNDPDLWRRAIAVGTVVTAHLSACKSLLDAAAISLTRLYRLRLSPKEMDFGKGRFWNMLTGYSPAIGDKYDRGFRPLSNDVIRWRDAAVHRATPLVAIHGSGDPNDPNGFQDAQVRMVTDPGLDIPALVSQNQYRAEQWMKATYLHDTWRPRFVNLCEELCADIAASL